MLSQGADRCQLLLLLMPNNAATQPYKLHTRQTPMYKINHKSYQSFKNLFEN